MCYTHLTTTERVKIETYQELGMSIRSIARRLGRQPSTVSREIRRNPDYVAERAETRGRINVGLPISKRPPEVRGRRTFGHWKLDTVVSGRGKSKACVATFIERKSRFYLALPIADRTAASMEGAIHAVHGAFPEGTFETATTDRGKEFSGHERIQASLRVPMYFVDPYSSWQRGSNENANGLLREFFPKGTDFAQVAHDELAKINGRPRKCLNWKTAHEAFTEEVLRLI